MDGERKFIVVVVSLAILCLTIMYCLLFFALWQYRIIVAVSLLVILLIKSMTRSSGSDALDFHL